MSLKALLSIKDVNNVTVAALRLPAGRLMPIWSNFWRSCLPPSLDLALKEGKKLKKN